MIISRWNLQQHITDDMMEFHVLLGSNVEIHKYGETFFWGWENSLQIWLVSYTFVFKCFNPDEIHATLQLKDHGIAHQIHHQITNSHHQDPLLNQGASSQIQCSFSDCFHKSCLTCPHIPSSSDSTPYKFDMGQSDSLQDVWIWPLRFHAKKLGYQMNQMGHGFNGKL